MAAVDCPDDNTLAALVDPANGPEAMAALQGHLDECERCRAVVELARGSTDSRVPPPSAWAELDRDPSGLVGTTIDERYCVAKLIGRGAMGTVYVARDVTLDRDVAIKVHRAGIGDTRLRREAVAMAQLAHPNVVNVFEVGELGAATYVAMEYVRGVTLRAWLAERPRRWRDILALLVEAGRGLATAHAAGLVHRDFKPENVLVGDDERPRISDFGLARLDRTTGEPPAGDGSIESTHAGAVVGTPAYMAPEQFAGTDVDARCDQFAFCVVAWESLYGQRPFAGATIERMRRAVERHELVEPPRSRVPDRVRRVLERGLAAAPADRYLDVPTLIAALRRAAAPRLARRIAFVSAALIACVGAWSLLHRGADAPCSAPAGGPSWGVPQRAAIAAAFSATGASYAATAWDQARQRLDGFAERWQAQARDVCLAHEVSHRDDDALHARRTSCLEQRTVSFDTAVQALRDPSLTRKVVAQAGFLLEVLPDVEACAHPDAYVLPTDATSRATHLAFFTALSRAMFLVESGRVADARRELPDITRLATAIGTKRPEALVAYLTGRLELAERKTDDAVHALESAAWSAEAAGYDELVAASAEHALWGLGAASRSHDADRFRALAIAAAERVGTLAARSHIARSIGRADLSAGRFDLAERELTSALALTRAAMGGAVPFDEGAELTDLGDLAYQRGQPDKAEPLQRRALELFRASVGTDHPATATALNNLGNTLAALGKLDDAAAIYDEAIAIRTRINGPDSADLAMVLNNAAGIDAQRGAFDRARADLERALAIDQRILEAEHPSIGHVLFNLGEISRLQGSLGDARTWFTRALEIRRKRLGDHHPSVTETHLRLATIELADHHLAAARDACAHARASIVGSDAHNTALAAEVDACDGDVALQAGQLARASALLEHALALHKGSDDSDADAAIELSLARALGGGPRAIELAEDARSKFASEGPVARDALAAAETWLREHHATVAAQ